MKGSVALGVLDVYITTNLTEVIQRPHQVSGQRRSGIVRANLEQRVECLDLDFVKNFQASAIEAKLQKRIGRRAQKI